MYSAHFLKINQGQPSRKRSLALRLFLGALFFGLSGMYNEVHTHAYGDAVFTNYIEQDLAFNEYARLAQVSEGKARTHYSRLLFDALPRDFATFFKMVSYRVEGNPKKGFCDNTYCSTMNHLFTYSHNPWGSFHVVLKSNCAAEEITMLPTSEQFPRYKERAYSTLMDLLPEVKAVVPAEIYYEKLLSVGVDGFWDVDDVDHLIRHLRGLTFDNPSLAVEVLDRKSDDAIASFWYCLYDGPYNDAYYEDSYYAIYERIISLSPRVGNLMQKAYAQVGRDRCVPGRWRSLETAFSYTDLGPRMLLGETLVKDIIIRDKHGHPVLDDAGNPVRDQAVLRSKAILERMKQYTESKGKDSFKVYTFDAFPEDQE